MTELVCIVCPNGCRMTAEIKDGKVAVSGNKCKKGIDFAIEEFTSPKRSVTSTVRTVFPALPVVPVRTSGDIPKEKIAELVKQLRTFVITEPLSRGQTVIENLFGTGVNLIITTDMKRALCEGV